MPSVIACSIPSFYIDLFEDLSLTSIQAKSALLQKGRLGLRGWGFYSLPDRKRGGRFNQACRAIYLTHVQYLYALTSALQYLRF